MRLPRHQRQSHFGSAQSHPHFLHRAAASQIQRPRQPQQQDRLLHTRAVGRLDHLRWRPSSAVGRDFPDSAQSPR